MSLATRIYAELRGDRAIWAVIALLSMFSVMAVYSSTGTLAYREMGGNTESFLVKHFLIVVGGLFLTYLAHLMHYMKYSRSAPVLLLISVPLLIYHRLWCRYKRCPPLD